MSLLKFAGVALTAAMIAVVLMNYPDLKRYLKIERM